MNTVVEDDVQSEDIKTETSLKLNEINSYSLQCFIDWIDAIESNDKIIQLDFDKIEQDLKQQIEKDKSKCKDLFYPNIQSYYTYKDTSNHQKDQDKIENWYKKLFAGEPSLIHYILYNKSFLYSLPKPDINNKQPKLDNIKKHSADLIHLNMRQSIYILRLLLFKYQIIPVDAVFEDNCTIMISIEEELRDVIISHTFDYSDIMEQYLKLIIDVASISNDMRQKAIFNILYVEKSKHFCGVNFFDNIDIKNFGWGSAKMPPNMIKELLFRGVPPLSIKIYEKYITEDDFNSEKNNIDMKTVLYSFIDQVLKLDWKQHFPRDESTFPEANVYDHYWSNLIEKLRAVTAPLIIGNFAKFAKQKMYNLLKKCIVKHVNDDCIYCILDFIYVDLDRLYPTDIDNNMIVKMGKYFNYLSEIDLNELLMNNILKKEYLTESMAKYLFCEIGKDIQEQMIHDVFKRKKVALETLYELCVFQKLCKRVFKKFMFTAIYGCTEIEDDIKELFVKIVSVNMLDSEKLNDESFIIHYRNELAVKVDDLFSAEYADHNARIEAEKQFINNILCFFVEDQIFQ